jgi:hypothetical protein
MTDGDWINKALLQSEAIILGLFSFFSGERIPCFTQFKSLYTARGGRVLEVLEDKEVVSVEVARATHPELG